MPLVSRRAYAKLRGVSEKAVRKAIDAGKIPLVDGQIDPAIADAAWSRNRDAGQQSKLAEAIGHPVLVPRPPVESPAPVESPVSPPAAPALFETAPLTAARIRNTEESTAIKEITRRKLEGGLLESEEVDRTWGEMLQVLKDRLRLIPDNIGDLLAGTNDAAECRSILMREILDALGAMSKGIAGMVA